MTRTAISVALLGTALASAAHSQVSVSSMDRFVRVAAEGGTITDGPRTVNGPQSGAWDHLESAAAVQGDNGGTSDGHQISSVGSGVYSAFLDGRANAFGDGSDFASGYGQSHFEMEFSVTGPSEYTLEGFVNGFGTINGEVSEAYIELVDLSDNSVVWSIFVDDSLESFNQMGVLAAGSYRFEADALAIVNRIFENGFGDATATADFTLTVVPAPASLALLGVGLGSGLLRRRR